MSLKLLFFLTFLFQVIFCVKSIKRDIKDHVKINKSCLWGTYRPGPYVGIRSKQKESFLFGLMWYYPDKQYSVINSRHFNEISDDVTSYIWEEHNGCDFGTLQITDNIMKVNFQVEFVYESDINHWVLRLKGTTQEDLNKRGIVFIWYITNKNSKNKGVNYNPDKNILEVGNYKIQSTQPKSNSHPNYSGTTYDKPFNIVMDISNDELYDPSQYIKVQLKDNVGSMPNHLLDQNDSYFSDSIKNGNVFVEQNFLIGNFTLDIHSFVDEVDISDSATSLKIDMKRKEFYDKFEIIFSEKPEKYKKTALSAMSSLFANLIYQNGKLQILNKETKEFFYSDEFELLTIAPDKTAHARGFMWDEGFQQRVLSIWDLSQSLNVIENWFSNIDQNTGWLAREQSLDDETRSRALPSSWASIPNISNPPSLFLFINNLIERNKDLDLIKQVLSRIVSNLEKNAMWYFNSQKTTMQEVYAWQGKTDEFCLPSGLDDYPRAKLNGKKLVEGHVDLQAWLISLSKTMSKIYDLLNREDKKSYWDTKFQLVRESLINNFWDEKNLKFDDFFIEEDGSKKFAGHTGYINLFPFILDNFSGEENKYKTFIDNYIILLTDSNKGLYTDYGIRSLSVFDNAYKSGQNYWTSPIWVNINFLILKHLNNFKSDEKLRKLYQQLYNNFVNNIVNDFEKTNYIWEVYDDKDGHGKYNRPFTGWSSLIVNLIYELY